MFLFDEQFLDLQIREPAVMFAFPLKADIEKIAGNFANGISQSAAWSNPTKSALKEYCKICTLNLQNKF
jgi:hypothetical protein